MTIDDNEIRRQFGELREADKDRAPAFAQTYGRAHSIRRQRATRDLRPLLTIAAAIIVIAAISLARGRSTPPPTTAPAIATWRAPTDVLLQTPGSELLADMPALGASVLDKMIPTTSNRGT